MSGEKRTPVQILRDQMHQMRNQVHSMDKHRASLQKALTKAQKQNKGQIRKLEHQMEQRNRVYDGALNSLQSDMQTMAKQHRKALNSQRKEFIKELQASERRTDTKIERLQDWTSERLDQQRAEYQELARQQQQQINQIKQNIQVLNSKEENRQNRATSYYNDLGTLIETADQTLPHHKFAPGKMNRIKRQLDAAQAHIQSDVPSAAIAVIQQAHFDLMDLEEEVQRKEAEFELVYGTALEAVTALLDTVKNNRNIELEEDQKDTQHEADYWTSGKFSELESAIDKIKLDLENRKDELSLAEVEQKLEDLNQLSSEQEALLKDAVERIISAQLRAEMGDVVIDALEGQGFRMLEGESGYAENDQRQPYMVKVENRSGTKVVTVISPDEQTHENIISVNTYDGGFHDEAAEQLRNKEIREALKEGGLNLGETECNASSIKAFEDVKSIVKSGSKGIPKKILKEAGMLNSQTENSNI